MSPPGRPKGEYRSAQREGTPMSDVHEVLPGAAAERLVASRRAISARIAARLAASEGGDAPAGEAPAQGAEHRSAWARAVGNYDLDHPLRSGAALVGTLARDHLEDRLAAQASKRPWTLVAGAALAGALIVVVRPWRWAPRPAVLASLLSQFALQALARRLTGAEPEERGIARAHASSAGA
jgi:hypothetical protein